MTFWNDLLANTLATIAGVAIGVPIALWLYRWQERAAEEARAKDESERRRKLLKLAREELDFDAKEVERKWMIVQEHRSTHLGGRVKTELWKALSDGGELRWIRDLDLTAKLAEAYYRLGEVVFLEERYTELFMSPAPKDPIMHNASDVLYTAYDRAKWPVALAISAIDKALS